MGKNNPQHKAGIIFLTPHNHILIVHQRNGKWSLPKGKAKAGERRKQTARREAQEETNIKARRLKKIGTFRAPKGQFTVWKATIKHPIKTRTKAKDILNSLWTNLHEALKVLPEWQIKAIRAAL